MSKKELVDAVKAAETLGANRAAKPPLRMEPDFLMLKVWAT